MTKIKTITVFLLALGLSGVAHSNEYITVVMEDGKLGRVNVSLVDNCGNSASGRSSDRSTSWSFDYYTDIEKIVYEDKTKIFVINSKGRLCSINLSSVSRLNNFDSPGVKIFDINKLRVKDASFYSGR